jgi:hypothetical protein
VFISGKQNFHDTYLALFSSAHHHHERGLNLGEPLELRAVFLNVPF